MHQNRLMFTGAKGKPIAQTYLQVTQLNGHSPPWFRQMERQLGIDAKVSFHAVNDNEIFATVNHPCGFFADGKSFSYEVKTLGDAVGTLCRVCLNANFQFYGILFCVFIFFK